jgi:hypothetical protein
MYRPRPCQQQAQAIALPYTGLDALVDVYHNARGLIADKLYSLRQSLEEAMDRIYERADSLDLAAEFLSSYMGGRQKGKQHKAKQRGEKSNSKEKRWVQRKNKRQRGKGKNRR